MDQLLVPQEILSSQITGETCCQQIVGANRQEFDHSTKFFQINQTCLEWSSENLLISVPAQGAYHNG